MTTLGRQIAELQKARVDTLYKRWVAYLRQGDPPAVIADFNAVLKRDGSYAKAYYYRGVSHLHGQEWIKAEQDFTAAQKGGVDVAEAFGEDFGSVLVFQQEHGLAVPFNLARLLIGVKERPIAGVW